MKPLDLNKIIDLRKNALVEASAGTGKTFSITKLVLQAASIEKIPIEKILVVTFTEAATKELRSRIRDEFHEFEKYISNKDENKIIVPEYDVIIKQSDEKELLEIVQLALLNIDQAPIFTIHGFCQRMLTENAFESKIAFGAELLTDTSELVLEIAENFWRKYMVNITKDEQKLLSGVKFEIIHKLTGNFIRCNNVELVNTSKYSLCDIKELLKEFDLEELKDKMLTFFEKYSDKFNKPFGTKYYENTIKELTLKNIKTFSYDKVSGKLNAAAKKNDFELPRTIFFDEVDKLKYAPAAVYEELFIYTKRELVRIKEERHILTFDDLIQKLQEVISAESERSGGKPLTQLIRNKFKIAFVDEFQDTDKIQYEIFKNIFGESSEDHGFFMIGDPKQSIFKFRGADIYSYLQAKSDSEIQYTLQKNFRSEKGMINAINALFQFKDKIIEKDLTELDNEEQKKELQKTQNNIFACHEEIVKIDFQPAEFGRLPKKTILKGLDSDKNLELWSVRGYKAKFIEQNICQNIAAEIIKLMEKDPLPYFEKEDKRKKTLSFGDFAILVNTNKQAVKMKSILSKSNIPAVIQNSAKIFESKQAREIKYWLKAILQPAEKNIRLLFVTDLLSKTAKEIEEISEVEILELTEQFKLLNQGFNEYGIYSAFIHFINKYKVMEKALKKQDGERIITNYFHIADLLHQNELNAGKNIEKTLAFLDLEMQTSDENDEKQEQLESDKEAVKIMTIHKSKGLQFPIIFCPFIWNNDITKGEKYQNILLFNEFENGENIQKLDLGADKNELDKNKKIARVDTLAEHVRLLYVALTRAENKCYLIFGEDKNLAKSVFAYIFTNKPKEFVFKLSGSGVDTHLKEIFSTFLKNINKFTEENPDLINFEKKEHISQPIYNKQIDSINSNLSLFCKKSKVLQQQWGVGSFSSLISNIPYENDNAKTGEGVFELPGGKVFGTVVHKIFENYFNNGPEIFTDGFLRKTMFENVLKIESYFRSNDTEISEKRFGTVEKMFQNTLNVDIEVVKDSVFQLKEIQTKDAQPEFSFYYKVKKISPKLLKEIFSDFIGKQNLTDFEEQLEKLDFSLKKGYLTGEIDLLFRKNNKYFVLDWKTNNLGAVMDDYSPREIKKNMAKHLYLLQAHIYSLATHLFLKNTLEGYDYNKHFGGFIYIYTRGVGPNGNGIYFNKPSFELIEELEKEICL